MNISLFLTLIFVVYYQGKHITILVDTAVPSLDDKYVVESKEALKFAFDQYISVQDTITAYGFSENDSEKILDGVLCSKRDYIHQMIDSINFHIGCSDWSYALKSIDPSSASKDVIFITDENPCRGEDIDKTITEMLKNHIKIQAIGIGYGVDKVWLKKISSSAYKWIQEFHYTHQNDRTRNVRHQGNVHRSSGNVTKHATGGEIAIAVIMGTIVGLFMLISLIYSCRHVETVSKIKTNRK